MSNLLDELRERNRERWIAAWRDRLGNCRNCDMDYIDSQAVVIDDEKSCPNCKKPEDKSYYYCEEHGSSGCCKDD